MNWREALNQIHLEPENADYDAKDLYEAENLFKESKLNEYEAKILELKNQIESLS